jgi:hypothetical protein
MNAKGQQELYLIKQELQGIIKELESIASGVQHDFEGIGNEKCAARVNQIADQYRYVKQRLNNIDTSKVSEQMAKS